MSKGAHSACTGDILQPTDRQTPRPRQGAASDGRRLSAGRIGAGDDAKCSDCRHWLAFVDHWGRCGGAMVRQYVDSEGPLVTRSTFSCKFFARRVAEGRTRQPAASRREEGEQATLHV
ncbi:MAG: hypothetical protein JNM75_04640 [Rhodospirillales bacterium]|nr:hypothetical protein [Rhodospirillales bacterium]